MAAAVAVSVSSQLVSKMIQHIEEELNERVPGAMKNKILSLQNELQHINNFLKESEEIRSKEMVEEQVNQMRDAAYQIEDVIEEYGAIVMMRQRYRSTWSKLFHVVDYTMRLRRIDVAIDRIQRSIADIHVSRDRYGIAGQSEVQRGGDYITEGRRVRTATMHVAEYDEVVGLVEESSFIMNQLMESGPRLDVVSIVGMGGLGKTVLARKVYHNKDVQELFPCRVWIYVSNEFIVKLLLMTLLKSLLSTSEYHDFLKNRRDDGGFNEETMIRKVRESLSGKKYLVVLDDVWETSVWDDIKGAFPDDNKGSKILLTTRLKEVAFSFRGSLPPYDLPFLSNEQSWALFSRKVFGGEDFPPDLIDLGRSLVESCKGLPLAIMMLARLAATTEKTRRQWSAMKNQFDLDPAGDHRTSSIRDVLKLSYDGLPQRLKACFLYFGIFPKDYEISTKELILLWIAEGFILASQETASSRSPLEEDVAEAYLEDLVERSLVHVASMRRDGGVKTCRIHNLLHDLCITEGKANKFLEVCTGSDIRGPKNSRKLSIQYPTEFHLSSNTGNDQFHTRSLFFFAGENEYVDPHLIGFNMLSVLNFRETLFKSIPTSLKRMIHLRYLRIRTDHYVKIVPAFICNLWNLETLDIRSSMVIAFPSKIWKLKRLRYLLGCIRMSRVSGKRRMVNLQTLNYVRLDPPMVSMVKNGVFPNLRKLVLLIEDENSVGEQLESLCNLKNLQKLRIKGNTKLVLDTDAFPSSLTEVCLHTFDKTSSRCVKALRKLPDLESLKIVGPIWQDDFDLNCAAEDFPRLQDFHMQCIVGRWTMEEGAMRSLRRLTIYDCQHLDELPEELFSLTTLQLVEIYGPSGKLRTSSLPLGSKLQLRR